MNYPITKLSKRDRRQTVRRAQRTLRKYCRVGSSAYIRALRDLVQTYEQSVAWTLRALSR